MGDIKEINARRVIWYNLLFLPGNRVLFDCKDFLIGDVILKRRKAGENNDSFLRPRNMNADA